jgi:Ca2+/H+ antiporter
MTKILSHYENKKIDVIVITSLVVSIITSSFFILYSPDQNIRDYNALLMSAISIGVALVIYLVQLFRYKNSIRKQHSLSKMSNDKQPHYYDNNKMHISICLFLVLWLVAQLMWLSQYEEISSTGIIFIADTFFS